MPSAVLLAVSLSAATPLTLDRDRRPARGGARRGEEPRRPALAQGHRQGGVRRRRLQHHGRLRLGAQAARPHPHRGHAAGPHRHRRVRRQGELERRSLQGRRDPFRTTVDEARGLAEDADIDGALIGWREKGHQAAISAPRTWTGRPRYKLRIALKGGDVQYVYLDPDYFLEIRRRERAAHPRRGAGDRNGFRQLRAGQRRLRSHRHRVRAQGRAKDAALHVETVEANSGDDDALFRFPAGPGTRMLQPPEHPAPLVAQAPPLKGAAAAPLIDRGVISGLNARNIGSAAMSGRIAAIAAHGRRRQDHALRRRGQRRRLEVARTAAPPSSPCSTSSRCSPSAPSRSIRRTRRPSGWAPASRGRATASRSATASTSRPTAARPGPTWACPNPSASPASWSTRRNSDTVYACVPGKLWSDSADRGLYKTTDGGKTLDAGPHGRQPLHRLLELAMDPKNPDVLFAGIWDFRRKGWTFRSGGEGPEAPSGSGLFRSTDGGATWTRGRPQRRVCRRSPGAASRWRSRRRTPSVVYALRRVDRLRALSLRRTAARPGRSATTASG